MKHIIEWYGIFFRFWMRWPEKIRYILVGGYNTVVSYALYTMFVFGGTSPQIALFLAFIVSSINGYLTQKFYVFNTRGNYVNEYIRCLMGWGISYALNAGLLALFLKGNMNPYVSQAVALILVTINSYLILKYIAFKPSKKEKAMRYFKPCLLIPLLILFCCGCWAAYSRNEIWYDLYNYHFYNGWAFLNGKTFDNYFVSGAYTFFAPLLDSFTYIQIKALNNWPKFIFFMNGVFHGTVILLVWSLLKQVIPLEKKGNLWVLTALTLYSVTGYAYTQQMGTTTHEITCAIIFLMAFYLFIKKVFFEHKSSLFFLFCIGGIIGGVLGLKLTIFPMCVGFGAMTLYCAATGQFKQPIKALTILLLGALIGFGLTDGWWLYLVWQKTGNPVFPMANHIFKSPLIPTESVRDIRFLPQTIGQWLFYPFYWGINQSYVTDLEGSVYHAVLPFSAAALLTGLLFFGKIKSPFDKAVIVFYDVSYVVWLVLFSILRYAIVLECLSGLMLFILFKHLKLTEKLKPYLMGSLIILSICFPLGYGSFHTVFNTTYLSVPPMTVADDTVVIVAENINSYLVPFVKTNNPVLGFPIGTLTVPLPWDAGTKQAYHHLLTDKKVLIISLAEKFKQVFEKNPDLFPRQELNLILENKEGFIGGTLVVAGYNENGIWHGIDITPGQTDRFISEMMDQEKR